MFLCYACPSIKADVRFDAPIGVCLRACVCALMFGGSATSLVLCHVSERLMYHVFQSVSLSEVCASCAPLPHGRKLRRFEAC